MNLLKVIKAGLSVWLSWHAILHEGISVADPRLLKQAQVLASAIMALVGAAGLSAPVSWINTASLAALALYALWSGAATLASTDKLGLSTVFQKPPLPSSPGSAAAVKQQAAARSQQVNWPDNIGNPWSRQ